MIGSPRDRAGFTLLELLAALTLASLVLGVVAVRLSASNEQARLTAAAGELRDLDRRARLYARSHGTASLLPIREEGGRPGLALRAWPSGEGIARAVFDEDVRVFLRGEDSGGGLLFDRSGRCADYEVLLRAGDREARWRVSGTTGWIDGEGAR